MYKKSLGIIGILFLTILLIVTGNHGGQALEKMEEGEGDIIRFHVIANSDSPQDQRLKLRVRDRIIEAMDKALGDSKNIGEARNILRANLRTMEDLAKEVISNNQQDYEVLASLERENFPSKRYGNMVLPTGEYETLKLTIGDGKGKNWWCVMFPPLCFIDVKNGLVDEETQLQLKENLSGEEYNLIFTSLNNEELPIKLKSKLAEIYRKSKEKLTQFASKF